MAVGTNESIISEILGKERGSLDRWAKGDPGGCLELCSPEITYFAPDTERRLDGREAMGNYYAALAGKIHLDRYELLNPKVQLHGNAAVLTFNYVSWFTAEGKTSESRWNATEVYSRMDGEWKLVHTHWSLTCPHQR